MIKGNEIRLYRVAKGINQHELARLIGSNISRISRLERHLVKIRPEEAENLAEVLGTKVELLMPKAKTAKG
jgi:transcriptional regulator with XRE-family HTH domain